MNRRFGLPYADCFYKYRIKTGGLAKYNGFSRFAGNAA
jgi:hypothetical protein